ncbi:MAG TPA: class I SAM-dependent methyltransferase [Candidatus Limnocylindria bacterium]|jgi:SAM-dependent methyltransferase
MEASVETQAAVDRRNEAFWDELCGTAFAKHLGLEGRDRGTLEAFDRAYFAYYPYLHDYVTRFAIAGRPTLEIGLGYGTLGEELVRQGADYSALDVAAGPVGMMQHRLTMLGQGRPERVLQGSVLEMPFPDGSFEYVYTIGCLHHTGDLPRAVEEVRRVLAPGGHAVVMVYHANSLRQWRRVRIPRALARLRGRSGPSEEAVAKLYDADASGAAPPHTDYVSRGEIRRLFRGFSKVEIRTRNFDDTHVIRWWIPRLRIIGTPLERWLGLDLYVVATR